MYPKIEKAIVSIHAPARGATAIVVSFLLLGQVSIHAPARGATTSIDAKKYWSKFQFTLPRGERQETRHYKELDRRFNSRSREGSDLGHLGSHGVHLVSIHAPARGATRVISV